MRLVGESWWWAPKPWVQALVKLPLVQILVVEALGTSLGEAATGADLGGSMHQNGSHNF